MVAYQNRLDLLGLGKVPDRRGSHLEEGSLFHMDLGHQGHQGRREGNRLAGTVLAVGSLVALVAGAVGLAVRPDVAGLAVPIAHQVSQKIMQKLNNRWLVFEVLRRKATEDIHTVLRSRWFYDLHPKILHHWTRR